MKGSRARRGRPILLTQPPPTALRLALLALALLAPALAHAQGTVAWQRLWPVTVGDAWQYEIRSETCPGHGYPCYESGRSFERWVAARDSVVDGATFFVFESATAACLVRRAPAGGFETRALRGNACVPLGSAPVADVPARPETVQIGGVSHVLAAVVRPTGYSGAHFGADVGLLQWYVVSCCGSGGSGGSTFKTLISARVGGVQYGPPAVAVGWERFLPAAPGDAWQYAVRDARCVGTACTVDTTYTDLSVTGTTVVGGTALPVYDAGPAGRFAYGVGGDGRLVCYALAPDGSSPPCEPGAGALPVPPGATEDFRTGTFTAPVTAIVGGRLYGVPAVKTYPAGGSSGALYAADVGLARGSFTYPVDGEGAVHTRTWTATYARVGGQTYGTRVPTLAWQRLLPAALGDTWQYTYIDEGSGFYTNWDDTTVVAFEVTGTTVLDGRSFPVLTSNAGVRFAYGLDAAGRLVCHELRADGTTPACAAGPRTLPVPSGGDFRVDPPAAPAQVLVGGQPYVVPARKWYGLGTYGDGAGFAADLGMFRASRRVEGVDAEPGVSRRTRKLRLVHARVGGRTYGTPVGFVEWVRFWPAAVGDEWAYEVRVRSCRDYGAECMTETREERFAAVDQTLVDGQPLLVFERAGGGRCAYGLPPGAAWFVARPLDGAGWCPPHVVPGDTIGALPVGYLDFPVDQPAQPRAVAIGPYTYTLAAVRTIGHPFYNRPREVTYGAEVGVVRDMRYEYLGTSSRQTDYRLMGARVGGAAYGSFATEPPPPPPQWVAWERFAPAAVADEWQYEVRETTCSAGGAPCRDSTRYERFAAVGDTVVWGRRLPLFERVDAPAYCALGVPAGGMWFVAYPLGGGAWCPPFLPPPSTEAGPPAFPVDQPRSPVEWTIGTQAYTLDAVRAFLAGDPEADGSEQRFGADVGVVEQRVRRPGAGGAYVQTRHRLVAARVGGAAYGAFVTPPAPPPPPDPEEEGLPLAVSVRPNPAGASARVALALPAEGPVRLEVLDLLGRIVLRHALDAPPAGASEHALDVARLAPGVYILRALTADGVAVVPFIRAD